MQLGYVPQRPGQDLPDPLHSKFLQNSSSNSTQILRSIDGATAPSCHSEAGSSSRFSEIAAARALLALQTKVIHADRASANGDFLAQFNHNLANTHIPSGSKFPDASLHSPRSAEPAFSVQSKVQRFPTMSLGGISGHFGMSAEGMGCDSPDLRPPETPFIDVEEIGASDEESADPRMELLKSSVALRGMVPVRRRHVLVCFLASWLLL